MQGLHEWIEQLCDPEENFCEMLRAQLDRGWEEEEDQEVRVSNLNTSPFISFVWIKFGLLSKHPFIQQEVQHNYAQWTLELIKFSIFNSGGKRSKASGQHLFGRDHRTWGARAARGGGAMWIGGLRHFHHSNCFFFFKRRNGNRRFSPFFNHLYQDDLYESKVIINPERFNFLHFWRSGDIDLRHNSEQITDLAFSIPPAQHFRLAVTFFLKQWHWFRSPCKIFYTKFVNSLARIDERLNIFSIHSNQGS